MSDGNMKVVHVSENKAHGVTYKLLISITFSNLGWPLNGQGYARK